MLCGLGIQSLQLSHVYAYHLLTSVNSIWISFCFIRVRKPIPDATNLKLLPLVAEMLKVHFAGIWTCLVSYVNQQTDSFEHPLMIPYHCPTVQEVFVEHLALLGHVLGPLGASVICQPGACGMLVCAGQWRPCPCGLWSQRREEALMLCCENGNMATAAALHM